MSICLTGNHEVKARKRHRCLGETYVKRSGVDPGEGFWTMKMHPECEKATAHWKNEDWESWSNCTLIRGTDQER